MAFPWVTVGTIRLTSPWADSGFARMGPSHPGPNPMRIPSAHYDPCETHADYDGLVICSFCKFVVGVSKFSSNYAVLGELGRFPIEHRIMVSHILYWLRLENEDQGSLLKSAFTECKESKHDFYSSILFNLSYLGLSNLIQSPHAYKESYVKSAVSTRLKDQYLQSFRQKLGSFKTLETCKGHNVYERSGYLDIVNNVKLRNVFTRLRINNNKLLAYSHSDKVNCEKCDVLENTEHMLFHCKRDCLVKERERFISQVSKLVPSYHTKGTEAKIKLLLDIDTKDEDLIKIICHHVNTMYSLRFMRT